MDGQLAADSHRWTIYASTAFAILVVVAVGWSLVAGAEDVDSDQLEAAIHDEINEKRTQAGVGNLTHDSKMQTIASRYSARMSNQGFFGHTPPGGKAKQTVACQYHGENLIKQSETTGDADEIAEDLVQSWMASESHRKNILNSRYSKQGVGVHIDGGIIVTQRLCA